MENSAERILLKHISKFDRNPPREAILAAMEEYASQSPPPTAEGESEAGIDFNDVVALRSYFRQNDRTPFEHHAYSIFDRMLKNWQASKSTPPEKGVCSPIQLRNQTDASVWIDRAIQMIKEQNLGVAGHNGIVSLLQYAKESHEANKNK